MIAKRNLSLTCNARGRRWWRILKLLKLETLDFCRNKREITFGFWQFEMNKLLRLSLLFHTYRRFFNGCLRVPEDTPLQSGPLTWSNALDQRRSKGPDLIMGKTKGCIVSNSHNTSSWNEVIMPLVLAIIAPFRRPDTWKRETKWL
jgi:hypothetical protein